MVDLIEPVKVLLEEVESVTHKPVKLQAVSGDSLYGGGQMNVKRAFGHTPAHVIKYVSDIQTMQYFISHECLHILRIVSVPSANRFTVKDDRATIKNGFRGLFGITHNPFQLPPTVRTPYDRLRTYIISGTLASGVQDIWVDQEVLRRYTNTEIVKELIEAYRAWKPRLLNDLNMDRSIFADKCFEVINASNWAQCRFVRSKFIEEDPYILDCFKQYPEIIALGDELIEATLRNPLNNYQDDINLIDEWASILGLLSCYFWHNEEAGKSIWPQRPTKH